MPKLETLHEAMGDATAEEFFKDAPSPFEGLRTLSAEDTQKAIRDPDWLEKEQANVKAGIDRSGAGKRKNVEGGSVSRIYGFRGPPVYPGRTPREMLISALSMPMSQFSTLSESAREGAIRSLGLGTAIKEFTIPEGRDNSRDILTSRYFVQNPLEIARRATQYFINDPESPALSEEAYKKSSWFRDGVPWDEAMTEQRASALAESFDAKKVREFYATKRPITAFLGNLAGQAVDPINYIPVAGQTVKAAAVARLGKVAGASVAASLDAAANTAIFGLATAGQRRRYGDEVSWQSTVSDIAMAALIGAAFGTIGGVLEARRAPSAGKAHEQRLAIQQRFSTLKATQEARIALNEAIDALAHAEDLNLSPNASGPVLQTAAKIASIAPKAEAPIKVNYPATISDVAESLKRVAEENPELDPKAAGATEFDRLVIADLQKHGFDGIKDQDDTVPPMPLTFNPELVDVPIVRKSEATRLTEIAMKPDSPEYARMQVEEAARANIRLAREIQIGNRLHNRMLRWADEKLMRGIALGKFDRLGMAPHMVEFNRQAIAKYLPVATRQAVPEGIEVAGQRVGKPEGMRDMADQYGVDLATGRFEEEEEIAQLAAAGRLTDEDLAELAQADEDFEIAEAYGRAIKALSVCVAG